MPVIKKMPRALVAGCAGFIGSHLVESLLQKDILVTGVDNLSTGKKIYLENSLQNPNFNFVQYDLNIGIPKEIENTKFDYMFHLASTESHTRDDIENIEYEILLTNSLTTRNLLDFSIKNNSKFVLASSLGIYQGFVSSVNLENYFGSSEEEERTFSYSEAKRFAEALVWQYYKKNGLDVRIVRLSEVYGPRMSLKSTASLGTLLDYFLHEQDLIVSGDGLSKERYSYVSDAVNLLETSILNENGRGLILPLVPNLTTPLEIAYLLKDISNGKLDILFRPSKKVDSIPTVEKIDVSSLNKIGFELQVFFKDGINKTIKWFGKSVPTISELKDISKDTTISPAISTKEPEEVVKRVDPNVKTTNKSLSPLEVKKNFKRVLFIIALTFLLTGVIIIGYELFLKNQIIMPKTDINQYLEDYKMGRYEDLITNINKPSENQMMFNGVFGENVKNELGFSEDYLVNYLKYISNAKYDLTAIYNGVFSAKSENNGLVRVSSVIAKIDAANRYLSLYEASLESDLPLIDIKAEQEINNKLLILANNTAELFSGNKTYLIVVTDSSKSAYFLGQPVNQYLLKVKDYNFEELTEVSITVESLPQIDFAEYATNYVKAARSKQGGDVDGVLFVDSKILEKLSPTDYALAIIGGKSVSIHDFLKIIKERKLIFFPTSSDVSIAGDLGITPVLAFSDSSDFIVMNIDNTGGSDSKSYLISNMVYSLTENSLGFQASLTLTLLHSGKQGGDNQGVFSGNINLLLPSSANSFNISSNGAVWKKSVEYQIQSSKYATNLITYPVTIDPGGSHTVTIVYQLSKPTVSGYNLVVSKIANIKLQNFTVKFSPLDPTVFSLLNFKNDGGVYKYTETLNSNLTLKF